MPAEPATFDRRNRRRQATIDEILDVALELMGEQGVAALSLSEVARRVGMRPPSLYQYFDSKLAIYDALFGRGAQAVLDAQLAAVAELPDADPLTVIRHGTTAFCRWCVDNPVYSQLLFWRPVPGFEPSPEAFAPSLRNMAELQRYLQLCVDAGQLQTAAASPEGLSLHSALITGLISQQLSNEPQATFEHGRFMALLPTVLDMFEARFAPSARGKR